MTDLANPDPPASFPFGDKTISPPVFLSPMSGVTDLAFRRLIAKISNGHHGMLVSEFVSVEGITRFNPKVVRQIRFDPDQRPFMVQVFGADPERMALGARMAEESGADFVEINSGCPAPKIVRKQAGSGLLKNLPLYTEVIRQVVRAVKVPVSVKVRLGFGEGENITPTTLRIAQEEGVQLFAVHGRTRAQGYTGTADWDAITAVKRLARIPIIGNGDIVTASQARDRLLTSGVDGVSIGRGILHNPWVLRQVGEMWAGKTPSEPTVEEQFALFRDYATFLALDYDRESVVLGRLKQLAARFFRGFRNGAAWRRVLLRTLTLQDFFSLLERLYSGDPEEQRCLLEAVGDLNGEESSVPPEAPTA